MPDTVSFGSWFPAPDEKEKKNMARLWYILLPLVLVCLLLITTAFYAAWDGILPYLFHFPPLSWLNSLALVGMVLLVFGSLWSMTWLVWASFKEASD